MILPVATLVLAVAPYVSRIVRATLLEVLDSDYVELARLKGIPERVVMRKHALLNAIVPGIQVIALQLAWLAGGVVLVETVFNYPGVGFQLVDSVQQPRRADGAGAEHDHRRGLRRGEPRRRPALDPAHPPRDGRRSRHEHYRRRRHSRTRSDRALAVAEGAAAEAVRRRWHHHHRGGPPGRVRPVLRALRRERGRRPAVLVAGRVRHRLPRPGRALPADVRRHRRSWSSPCSPRCSAWSSAR